MQLAVPLVGIPGCGWSHACLPWRHSSATRTLAHQSDKTPNGHHHPWRETRRGPPWASQSGGPAQGGIVSVHGLNRGETDIPLERLHALSVNMPAVGGNASRMTID
ncbi:MAG: hypothetical protein E6Q69_09870 [Aquipseudomonas alcaligenes]|uniref:Uncharacterized protein n=1 Tax=Aquipseudomonas alcaligenes TaxID=43263 RepID=A0A5C7W3L5_AQUAC|nr:MAG: hypothetical protein E6Q69_09870 [Pseudomonas alcaligenes]